MIIVHAAALIAVGTVGFLAGGVSGVVAVVVGWTVALIALWRIQARIGRSPPEPAERRQPSAYADIEDVIDRLDDLARERNWDLGKRFDIARMACENRTTAFDELERRYDRGLRSAFDRLRPGASEGPKNDEGDSGRTTISSPAEVDSKPKCTT
jgi:hypothetical protein